MSEVDRGRRRQKIVPKISFYLMSAARNGGHRGHKTGAGLGILRSFLGQWGRSCQGAGYTHSQTFPPNLESIREKLLR